MLRALEQARGRLPGTTCSACEQFLDRFASEASDLSTGRALDADILTKLVFRTYRQHQQDEWTSRALDLIDRICLEGVPDAHQELDDVER